jgi:XTP/dITP diphosphohydrolase
VTEVTAGQTQRCVFATHNAHKRGEVEAIMREVLPEVELLAPTGEPPVEDGVTFAENALIKARAAFQAAGMTSLADDSGIAVDSLGGEPGIHSARYSPTGDDRDNLELLLENLRGQDLRSARFVCAVALVSAREEHVLTRVWEGSVAREAAGAGGFGYDPVFIPQGREVTAAELTAEEKNRVSHRGQAFRAIAEVMKKMS